MNGQGKRVKRPYRWTAGGLAKTAERMRALHADPEFRAKAAERMRALNADPEFKAKTAERMRALHADPEFRAKTAERMRALHADPEFKAKAAERMRALHADHEFRAKMGFLTGPQIDDIAQMLRAGRRYVDIALDYLITESHVARLAKTLGLQRRPRRAQTLSTEAGGFQ